MNHLLFLAQTRTRFTFHHMVKSGSWQRRFVGGAFGVGWALFPTDSGGLGGAPPNRRRRARRFFYLKTSLEALEP